MSDLERGARQLDIIQIHDLCNVLGCDLVELIQDFVNRTSNDNNTGPVGKV